MATKPVKPIPAAAAVAEKPKNPKLMVIIIAVLVLIIAGGAGWFFTRGGNHADAAKETLPMEPKFVELDPFTVNLQHEEAEQFLQIGITLKVTDPAVEEKIKLRLPEIRSRLLLLLSAKRASELAPAEGKKKLAEEIIAEAETVLGLRSAPAASSAPAQSAPHGGSGITDVLFTAFIIQ